MNSISTIEKYANDAVVISDSYKAILAKESDNFAYGLSLITINSHINDLYAQLRREKEAREKEVIQLRLLGEIVNYGTIPLAMLGDVIRDISDSILCASYRIKKGINSKGNIPKYIIDTLDLRFAGIGSGSTRIFLTAKNSPDIFGQSLTEKSLQGIFDILTFKNQDELIESVSNIGSRSTYKINTFLKKLNKSGLEVEISWNSPSFNLLKWEGNNDNILFLLNSLENLHENKPEYIDYCGELIMGSLKSKFEILDEVGISYLGNFPDELKEDIKNLHLGDRVTGIIEKNVILNRTTGREKINYTLLKIQKKDI